jgi:hypothetical protein
MIPPEEWLDPEEWRELGESEVYLYKKLADSCGLDMNNRRDGEFLAPTSCMSRNPTNRCQADDAGEISSQRWQ